MVQDILGDVRLSLRRLLKTPAASLTVVTALSVGIGLCALMLSVIEGAILPTLPVAAGWRVVHVARADRSPISSATYLSWQERQRSFEGLAIAAARPMNLAIDGRSVEPVSTAAITPSALSLLAVQPESGRAFTSTDAASGAPSVVLISNRLWRTRLAADAGAIGRVVRIGGVPAEIVGVLPDGFGFPWNQDMWTPLQLQAGADAEGVFGILREGVAVEAAEAELHAIDMQRPRDATESMPTAVRLRVFTDIFNPPGLARLLAGVMFSVSLLVLLVAAANVTNVLLARTAARSREVAVRTALGASRVRIALQFWLEVSLLTVFGAAGGTVLAVLGMWLLRDAFSTTRGLPFWWKLELDLPVLAFISAAAALAALVAGVGPALLTSRAGTHEYLKDDPRTSSSGRMETSMRRLVGAEMAVSLVLLIAGGLYIRSVVNLQTREYSFAPEQVYTANVEVPDKRYEEPGARAALGERLETVLAALPGASAATLASTMPGLGADARTVAVEGVDLELAAGLPMTRYVAATPGFFRTFAVTARAGRLFDSRDRSGAVPVAIVTASFERLRFPDGAIGRRIALPERTGEPIWLTIVGVIPDLVAGGVGTESQDAVYVPFAQAPPIGFQVAVRSRASADAMAAPVRIAVASVDRDAILVYPQSLRDAIRAANASSSWLTVLFLVAGGLALALAAVGLYGIMAFWVAQRSREIGVRMAVGGGRGSILRLVLRRGLTPVTVGLAVGMLAAVPVAWGLRTSLLGVTPFDPLVFGTVVGILLCAGTMGSLGPALRATRIDPQAALAAD